MKDTALPDGPPYRRRSAAGPWLPGLITATALTFAITAQAQLAYYEFNNSLVSSDANSESTASLVSLVGLGTVAYNGSLGAPAPSLYLANTLLPKTGLSTGSYLEFTMSAGTGYRMNLQALSFDAQVVAGNGQSHNILWQVSSSLDNYSASLGSGTLSSTASFTTATVDLSASKYDALMAITFRLYFAGDNKNGGKDGVLIDNLKLAGTTAVPEPHEWALLAAGSLAAFGLHQRCTRRDRA